MRGRQSGSSVSSNPLDDWTSSVLDKANSFGAGANLAFVPEKWTASLFARWQKVNGNNDLTVFPGRSPRQLTVRGGRADIPAYDDTEIVALNAEVKYQFRKAWAFVLRRLVRGLHLRRRADDREHQLRAGLVLPRRQRRELPGLVGLPEAVVPLVRERPNRGYLIGAWIDFRYSTTAAIFSLTFSSE